MVGFCKYTFEGVVPSWEDTQTSFASPFGHTSPGAVDPNHPAILDFQLRRPRTTLQGLLRREHYHQPQSRVCG